MDKSDYIIYADESGDHGLDSLDSDYPVFVLSFCVFRISDYITNAVPLIQKFKFDHFGHDQVILHEHHIRKQKDNYAFLCTDPEALAYAGMHPERMNQFRNWSEKYTWK
ncbi:DUF3800 domain-containing protein [Chryseobacterium sp. cx-311]|uniref:DUF3800 domain-containing protein n=1 Tax=Marnyiella aurantia TaxID=2758037 RepID=UPI001AEB3940|nr:DUF3800 domain-containing protein [Marnyiella aurantia]MBP0613919.1 DUF3800 domain-containing protein [Marnyiella aurantia]